MKCTLLKEMNKCPHCNMETMICCAPNSECAFREEDIKTDGVPLPDKYVRKERWYEKYWKK